MQSLFLRVLRQIGRELRHLRFDAGHRLCFYFAVPGKNLSASLGDLGPSSAPPARTGDDQRMLEAPVDYIDQIPCPSIGHTHAARGAGYGPGFRYRFKQVYLARSQGGNSTEQDASLR